MKSKQNKKTNFQHKYLSRKIVLLIELSVFLIMFST